MPEGYMQTLNDRTKRLADFVGYLGDRTSMHDMVLNTLYEFIEEKFPGELETFIVARSEREAAMQPAPIVEDPATNPSHQRDGGKIIPLYSEGS